MNSLEEKRHTLAHLLAAAVLELYPDAKRTIGPAIDNGFYFDFEFPTKKPSEADLERIADTMRDILPTWTSVTKHELSAEEAKAEYPGNPYKEELIDEFTKDGQKVTFYKSGTYWDLCRGGHAENPARDIPADSFMLERIAGAYWRGDEKNAMLTRIYGLAFDTKEDLDAYVAQQEEARKRDHRKLGAELKLFTLSSLVGSGLPLLQPKGAIIRREIEEYLWELHKNEGYGRVWTPHLAKEDLYIASGHAGHYLDDMFSVFGGTSKEKFHLKPMNCPHHIQIFADNQFSYRDMPVRYFEPATVYRDEKTGQLSGLTRVRSITQDDGHLFCRPSQLEEEVSAIVGIIKKFYGTMKMLEGYWVSLSVRGPGETYLGSDDVWEKAESALEKAAKSNDLPYKRVEGEAAFYGPKLDFMFKDAIGREWQLATIQCDFNQPARFELSYTNEAGEKEQPVIVHRAISGSLERFMGVMIEHYAGAFPTWLAPEQVRVLPVSEKHTEYAATVIATLKKANIRVTSDEDESLGKRIRNAKGDKVPYLLVVGDKEAEAGEVSVESRDRGQEGATKIADFVEKVATEIHDRA